jgi:hypothetical protein
VTDLCRVTSMTLKIEASRASVDVERLATSVGIRI